RLSGWLLIATVFWLGLHAVALGGPYLVGWAADAAPRLLALYGAGAVTGLLSVVGGFTGLTPGAPRDERGNRSGGALDGLVRLAAPIFALFLGVLMAWALAPLPASALAPRGVLAAGAWLNDEAAGAIVVVLLLAFAGWGFGQLVNTNLFSLHGLYRNRLVRA